MFESERTFVACAGLCGLVTSSYTEDKYGVVQQTLPGVLQALLQLNVVKEWGGGAGC